MPPALLADIILLTHALFIATVVLATPLILLGGWRHWRWVRSWPLRLTHLAMIGFVAGEALIGMSCPLTVWESGLRQEAGQHGYSDAGFLADTLGHVLFYAFPPWVFTALYVGYGLLVLALFVLVPPRRRA